LCVFVGSAIGILCAYLLYKFANPQNTPWYIYAITWLGCHSSPFAKHILVTCRTASAVSGCGLALFEISAASSTALTLSHPPPLAPEPALLPCALAAGLAAFPSCFWFRLTSPWGCGKNAWKTIPLHKASTAPSSHPRSAGAPPSATPSEHTLDLAALPPGSLWHLTAHGVATVTHCNPAPTAL